MAKRILVAVDHPPPAELLDLVNDAARGGGALVRLIHVAPPPDNLIGKDGHVIAYADQERARLEAEGLDMLRTVELHFGGVPIDSVVRFGDPAAEIVREAESSAPRPRTTERRLPCTSVCWCRSMARKSRKRFCRSSSTSQVRWIWR